MKNLCDDSCATTCLMTGAGRTANVKRLREQRAIWLASASLAVVLASTAAQAGGSLRGYTPPTAAEVTAAAQVRAAAAAEAAAKQVASMAAARQALQGAEQIQNIARTNFVLRGLQNAGTNPATGAPLPNVPNGLGTGGLDYNKAAIDNDSSLWRGADLPTTFTDGGKIIVNIKQTAQNAALNWQTFNVGANTVVNYLQGGSNWTALNRVSAGSANPTQILGQINAPGTVYIINQNGIIFGGGAQVNVHSLIASSLDVGSYGLTRKQRDDFFLSSGIAASISGATTANFLSSFSATLDPKGSVHEGSVVVQAGAQLTAAPTGSAKDEPGFVFLFGPNVANYGSISAPIGEVALVAALDLALTKKTYSPLQNGLPTPSESVDTSTPIRGVGFQLNTGRPSAIYPSGTGEAINGGLISTPGGTTVLNGDRLTMSGVISADSGINRNSQVFLDAVTSVTLSGTISMQPLENGDTPLPTGDGSSSITAFSRPLFAVNAFQTILSPTALVSAPSATVAITGVDSNFGGMAPNRSALPVNSASAQIIMQSGATIDVSGLQNVSVPADYNIVSFQVRGNETADSPLLRSSALFGKTVYVDIRDTGTRSDGTTWIGTPLVNANGYASLVGRKIDQLLTPGGTVTFSHRVGATGKSTVGAGGVQLEQGSSINVAGGSVSYQPGLVRTTFLVGSDGRIYSMAKADPTITYLGIYGQFTLDHGHWKITETFDSPYSTIYQPGYQEGRDAGGISVAAASVSLGAQFQFGAEIGPLQAALGQARSSALGNGFSAQATSGQLPSQGWLSVTTPQSIVITDNGEGYDKAAFTPTTTKKLNFSASGLSSYGLSGLSLTGNDFYLPQSASLQLAAGGQLLVTASGAIDVEGTVSVRSGQITLKTDSYKLQATGSYASSNTASGLADITVGGLLDVRGLWVNDTRLDPSLVTGPGYLNGGSIVVKTVDADGAAATGNVTVTATGILDASSGGYVGTDGKAKSDSTFVMSGKGGNITLAAFDGTGFDSNGQNRPTPPKKIAVVNNFGTLRSYGFSSGGTLTIQTPQIQIGGTASGDPAVLNLSTGFFTQGGFSSYVLKSPDDVGSFARSITVADGAQLTLNQTNFTTPLVPTSTASGADVLATFGASQLPPDLRKPVNLTLTSTALTVGTGAVITTDAGASVSLLSNDGTGGVSIRGSIVDHGGTVAVSARAVWLGPQASIDVSGTFVKSTTFDDYKGSLVSGKLWAGGSVSFDTTIAGIDTTSGVRGFVVAERGASIDVSGAAADIAGRTYNNNAGQVDQLVSSWSDAGTVSFNTGSLLYDGQFRAEAGAAQGNRGTLWLGGSNMTLIQQNGSLVTSLINTMSGGVTPSARGLAALSSPTALVAAADQLAAFDTVYLYAGVYNTTTNSGGAADGRGFFITPKSTNQSSVERSLNRSVYATLSVIGDVDLSVRNRLSILANSIVDNSVGGSKLGLQANYVMLAGTPGKAANAPAAGNGRISIDADTIDVQSATFSKFASVAFRARHDIRLMSPTVDNSVFVDSAQTSSLSTFYGQLWSAGDLSFEAERLYPVSAVDFEIISSAANGTVTFSKPAGTATPLAPLSAGGSLTVSAANIVQGGNLYAPLGKIALGATKATDLSANDTQGSVVPTRSVRLLAGSITSVALADGQIVPYGQTEDGINWFYNADAAPLGSAPTKSMRLSGLNVAAEQGSTIDVSGGGDLLAFEFVNGKGGTKDVLSSSGSNATVYAVLPADKYGRDAVGAFDIHFTSYLGDTQAQRGQQVYLTGVKGLADGWYTLYDAHYATLPGAYRLVDYGSALANPTVQAGSTLNDGTQIVAGYFGQSALGLRSSGTELFSVQSSSVWRQYTEVQPSYASSYSRFSSSAGTPDNGGRLAVIAASQLSLAGTIVSAPHGQGLGGQLDLAAAKIDVVETGAAARAGYTAIDVNQIRNAGFESVLIGGTRSDISGGTLITPVANDVRVDLSATALTAPELILVAGAGTASASIPIYVNGALSALPPLTVQAPSGGNVTIAAGSVVTATGAVNNDTPRNYILGSATSLASYLGGTLDTSNGGTVISGVSLGNLAAVTSYGSQTGSGSLLVVSNASQVNVTRRNTLTDPVTVSFAKSVSTDPTFSVVLPGASGSVIVEAGASVGRSERAGGAPARSVVLNATAQSGGIQISTAATIAARALTLSSSSIAVGDNLGATAGLTITRQLLPQLTAGTALTLQALGAGGIAFSGFLDNAGCIAGCPITLGDKATLGQLTLDTASLTGVGLQTRLAATKVTLANTGSATPAATAALSGGGLFIDANEIDLNGGTQAILGFSSVQLSASEKVLVNGAGSLVVATSFAGSAVPIDVAINTPVLQVGSGSAGTRGTGSKFALTTQGNLRVQGTRANPLQTTEIGGNLQINAAQIVLDQATIQATSGTVTLHATGAAGAAGRHIIIGDGSLISAPGQAKTLIDKVSYSPGGKVVLNSDAGDVITSATARIDLAQPDGGAGWGGELDIIAQQGSLVGVNGVGILDAMLAGGGAAGKGGIFHLDTKGGLAGNSLDPLAAKLGAAGFTGEVSIHTRTGGLELASGTLKANTIQLTADDKDANLGRVRIGAGATLDASGTKGGKIEIYARSVDLFGNLSVRATAADQAGGTIKVGTTGTASGLYDATYGYQLVSDAGLLNVGSTASFDLRGGAAGGTLSLRVPLLADGSANIAFGIPADKLASQIRGAKDVIVEAYAVWSTTDATTGNKHFDGIIDPAGTTAAAQAGADHRGFYQTTLAGFTQRSLNTLQLLTSAQASRLSTITNFHLRPGVELINPDLGVNGGDITVASAWNLAAGTMGNLSTYSLTFLNGLFPTTISYQYFNPATSTIQFVYRFGTEPGALTLRAARDISVNASITDGFFDYQNLADSRYATVLQRGYVPWAAAPVAPVPTDTQANAISPTTTTTALAAYDLFPDSINIVTTNGGGTKRVQPDSWSYRLTSGADFASADPNAVRALSNFTDASNAALLDRGNVVIDKRTVYTYTPVSGSIQSGSVNMPTMLRTGTGDIDIAAARNLVLADKLAPGVIYSAGRNSALLSSPGATNTGTTTTPVLNFANPTGFVEPNLVVGFTTPTTGGTGPTVGGAIQELGKVTGPTTAPSFPVDGGNITITAQQDIIGWQDVSYTRANSTTQIPIYQFYAPWIYAQASGGYGSGAYATPTVGRVAQTAWWIEYGRFGQGVLSAGGDITVVAGRDIKDFSVSLPTTGRVSGGLTAFYTDSNGQLQVNTPVTRLYGSGNLSVRAGGDWTSGTIYEGSGIATIRVAGQVRSDWTGLAGVPSASGGGNVRVAVGTVLAVDTGQIDLVAGGAITIGNIINPAEMHLYTDGGLTRTAMDTYGPNSAIRLTSLAGSVALQATPLLLSNDQATNATVTAANPFGFQLPNLSQSLRQTYPAILEITALNGDISMPTSGVIMTSSVSTTLNLLAQGSVNLGGSTDPKTRAATTQIVAGASLVDLAFDPYHPNMGNAASSTITLAHASDPSTDLYDSIYAVTGSITGGGILQIPRPVQIRAGLDIVDVNVTLQNIRDGDVSTISAGRDLYYTGTSIGGGIQVAGPGYLEILAGEDLGPFLPASSDTKDRTYTQQGIVSSGNAASFRWLQTENKTIVNRSVEFPVGNNGNYDIVNFKNWIGTGVANTALVGPADTNGYATGRRNSLLSSQGASLVTMFGVKNGIDYQSMIAAYLYPAIGNSRYLDSLASFMTKLGLDGVNAQWSSLTPAQQRIFVDQMLFAEINRAGELAAVAETRTQGYATGYKAINTMFPAKFGYTDNSESGTLGAKNGVVKTGDMNLLHATVQTARGGDISIFGPGGDIIVGSLAIEPNPNLKLNNLGILTLNGGNVNSFTDGSVLVNSSRVFTELGGAITMWSSNRDLDAGRGAKTTASLNALTVDIDNNAYQSPDRGGLVTGAGIGTLAVSADVPGGKVTLLAPVGTIDAGDAGIRSSGDLVVIAAVIANSGNFSVSGSVTSSSAVAVPSLGALTAGQNTPTQSQGKPDVTGSTQTQQPSVILVNVIGYGGGDGGAPAATGTTSRSGGGNDNKQTPAGGTSDAPASQDFVPVQ